MVKELEAVQISLFDQSFVDGASVPVERYRHDKRKVMELLGEVASGGGYVNKLSWGNDKMASRKIDGVAYNNRLRLKEADQILGRNELIEAGFTEEAVDDELESIRNDLEAAYFGKGREKVRNKEYRRLKKPIKYDDEDLDSFDELIDNNPRLASRRNSTDHRRGVNFYRQLADKK